MKYVFESLGWIFFGLGIAIPVRAIWGQILVRDEWWGCGVCLAAACVCGYIVVLKNQNEPH